MTLTRRGFVAGLAALIAAPAIVRASSMDYIPRGFDITYAPWVKTGPGRFDLVGQFVRLNGRGYPNGWSVMQPYGAGRHPPLLTCGNEVLK